MCPGFSSESIYAGNFYLENYLISSLNDFCKRKKTPENGCLDSSRLVWPHSRPSRGTGPHRFTPCRETPSFSAVEHRSGARCATCLQAIQKLADHLFHAGTKCFSSSGQGSGSPSSCSWSVSTAGGTTSSMCTSRCAPQNPAWQSISAEYT